MSKPLNLGETDAPSMTPITPDVNAVLGLDISDLREAHDHSFRHVWLDDGTDDMPGVVTVTPTVGYDVYSDEPRDWSVDVTYRHDRVETDVIIPWSVALLIRERMAWMEANLEQTTSITGKDTDGED